MADSSLDHLLSPSNHFSPLHFIKHLRPPLDLGILTSQSVDVTEINIGLHDPSLHRHLSLPNPHPRVVVLLVRSVSDEGVSNLGREEVGLLVEVVAESGHVGPLAVGLEDEESVVDEEVKREGRTSMFILMHPLATAVVISSLVAVGVASSDSASETGDR